MRHTGSVLFSKAVLIIFLFFYSCDPRVQPKTAGPGSQGAAGVIQEGAADGTKGSSASPAIPAFIGVIPPPAGYRRVTAGPADFAGWLRRVRLRRDRTVYLFDGSRKRNQDAQFAVLDISVGHKDLQQCADAVMRLRAEYLYSQRDFSDISFYTGEGIRLNFLEWAGGKRYRLSGNQLVRYAAAPVRLVTVSERSSDASGGSERPGPDILAVRAQNAAAERVCFDAYLETVFSFCGTLSLEKQLTLLPEYRQMEIGDVFIRGGSPGHAMLVVDMAEDSAGRKVFMLAQSYMPAQDIHIVRNPLEQELGPWYRLDEKRSVIVTPEWTFEQGQLRSWINNYITDY